MLIQASRRKRFAELCAQWTAPMAMLLLLPFVLPLLSVSHANAADAPPAGVAATPTPTPTAATTQPAAELRSQILAYRMADLAQLNLMVSQVRGSQYRQSAAFLEAASRLQPQEGSFHRLGYEALIKAGDVDGAIGALVKYARLDPNDRFAQLRLVDLYAQQQETADNRIKYLSAITQTTPVPEEVRGYAAYLLARTMVDRGDTARAKQQLTIALKYNPLCLPAMNLRYSLMANEMSQPERVSALLNMLRANPMQSEVLSSVATELSDAGLGNESLPFYDGALRLTLALNSPADPALVRDLANRLLQNGDPVSAEALMRQVLQYRPDDVSAHCIRLSAALLAAPPAAPATTAPAPAGAAPGIDLKKIDTAVQVCLINQLAAIARVNGDAGATTRPADSTEIPPLPDLVKLATQVAAANDTTKSQQLAAALNDYGVYQAVFAGKSAGLKPVIAALKALGPNVSGVDLSVTRLEGWQFLLDGKPSEARVKLSAVSTRDPLSALGLVKIIYAAQPGDAQSIARKLLSDNPSGAIGAMIYTQLKPMNVAPVLQPIGEQVKAELAQFPLALLRFGEQPQTFYTVRADPVQVAVDYSSPVLGKITVTNLSKVDLTIGDDGAIRPDLVIDVVAKGPRPGTFPRSAFDYINNAIVLKPRQSISRVVRLDQGRLSSFLGQTPQFAIPLFATLTMNPMQQPGTADAGGVEKMVPGPGGVSVQFSSLFERQAAAAQSEIQRQILLQRVATGPTDTRIAAMEAVLVYYQQAKAANDAKTPEVLQKVLAPLATDTDVAVRGWSTYLNALILPAADRKAAVLLMTSDTEWVVRLLGLGLVPSIPVADRAGVIAPLLKDPDATVAALARAQNDELIEGEPPTVPATTTAPVK